jgi:Ca-activated chloride channel homolog
MSKILRLFLLCLVVFGLVAGGAHAPAKADGMLILGGVYRQPARSHISVKIEAKIATTTLEQTFTNLLDKQVSALYVAPIPPSATLLGFAQNIDGQWVEATIEETKFAQKQYDEAAKAGEDAALITGELSEGIDPALTFRTQIVLPALADRSLRLTYIEPLAGEVGLTRYTYPLSFSHLSSEPVADLKVQVEIIEEDEIRAIYSPSHAKDLSVTRNGANEAVAIYTAKDVVPALDFEVVYTQSGDQFGLNLASYQAKDEDEDGYFVLIASPQTEAQKAEVVQKDFVFVLDHSGSMSGEKFAQARKALLSILNLLNEGDRFTIVAFDDNVTPYTTNLLGLDKRNEAANWVRALEIEGGTNIHDALMQAFSTVDTSSERPHIVVFLTDGQAANGITDTATILKNVRERIAKQSRLYTIGIGEGDVNEPLLSTLASENRGNFLLASAYGDINSDVRTFYEAIDSPVLVDIALDFGGMEVYDLYPNPIPDMFLGGQLVISGRYKGGGPANITLSGNINGQAHTSTYKDINFIASHTDAKNAANSYVPRLWAQRKADSLSRQIAIYGEDPKLVEQVKSLGMKYKIITPYTALVVTDPNKGKPNNAGAMPATGLPDLANSSDAYRQLNTLLLWAGGGLMLVGLLGLALLGRKQQKS